MTRWWWKLPAVIRGLVLVAACYMIEALIGNPNSYVEFVNVMIIGILTIAFILIEDKHRKNTPK
jgi:hypothetical protein